MRDGFSGDQIVAAFRRAAEAIHRPEDGRRAEIIDRATGGGTAIQIGRTEGSLPGNRHGLIDEQSVITTPNVVSDAVDLRSQLQSLAAAILANRLTVREEDGEPIAQPEILTLPNGSITVDIDTGDISIAIMTNPTTADGDVIVRQGGAVEALPIGASDQVLTVVGGLPAWADATGGGGGGSAGSETALTWVINEQGIPQEGAKFPILVPFDAEITRWYIMANIEGDVVLDVWVGPFAGHPLDDSYSITASAQPTLSGAEASSGSSLSGWTTLIPANSIVVIEVESVLSAKELTFVLVVERV